LNHLATNNVLFRLYVANSTKKEPHLGQIWSFSVDVKSEIYILVNENCMIMFNPKRLDFCLAKLTQQALRSYNHCIIYILAAKFRTNPSILMRHA